MTQDETSGGQGFVDDQLKLFKENENAAWKLAERAQNAFQLAREQQADLQNRLWHNLFQTANGSDGAHYEARKEVIDLESDTCDGETINSLQTKLSIANDEVVEAHKMAVQVLESFPEHATNQALRQRKGKVVKAKQPDLGVKVMGSIDDGPWTEAYKRIYRNIDWEVDVRLALSEWETLIRNPTFQPFKVIRIGEDKWKQEIDHKDPKLTALKAEFGEKVYSSVITALLELEEYNASGRYPVHVVWNFKESRKASLRDIIAHLGAVIRDFVPPEAPAKKPRTGKFSAFMDEAFSASSDGELRASSDGEFSASSDGEFRASSDGVFW